MAITSLVHVDIVLPTQDDASEQPSLAQALHSLGVRPYSKKSVVAAQRWMELGFYPRVATFALVLVIGLTVLVLLSAAICALMAQFVIGLSKPVVPSWLALIPIPSCLVAALLVYLNNVFASRCAVLNEEWEAVPFDCHQGHVPEAAQQLAEKVRSVCQNEWYWDLHIVRWSTPRREFASFLVMCDEDNGEEFFLDAWEEEGVTETTVSRQVA